jgi:hypothetical protein
MGRRFGKRVDKAIVLAACGVTVAAIAKELRQPSELRTWHGRVLGLPYDFRFPTWDRVRAEFWDPDSAALLKPHAFGVGYGVNLARVIRRH